MGLSMGFIERIAGRGWRGWLVLAAAFTACGATWLYGFGRGGATGLVFLPVGLVVFFATLGALAMPVLSLSLVAVAAIIVAESGLHDTLVLAAKVFLGVGLLGFAWQVLSGRWRR